MACAVSFERAVVGATKRVTQFESVATEIANDMMLVREESLKKHIQVTLKSSRSNPIPLRDLGVSARAAAAFVRGYCASLS